MLFEQTGDVQPVSCRNGPTRGLWTARAAEWPGIYLYEIKDRLEQSLGVTVSISTICHTLQFMEFSQQAMHHVAIQQSDAMRARFMAEVSMYNPALLVWIDVVVIGETAWGRQCEGLLSEWFLFCTLLTCGSRLYGWQLQTGQYLLRIACCWAYLEQKRMWGGT